MQNKNPILKIVAHHVGARGFGVSFNAPDAFRPEVTHVLYEADAESVERMRHDADSPLAQALSEKYVLPYCLGRKRSSASLNITANSYASSLFPPDPGFYQYYCEIPIDTAIYDVAYREMLEVARKTDVQVHSLDELFAEGKIPVATPPDFLSLDTQGYELEILEGAKNALSQGVLGIVSEVEMIPMYSGQPLLGDILNFMTRQGFIFAGFTAIYEISPHRAPIGFRARAFPGFGDALFLRDLATLTGERLPADRLYVMAAKLAFIAVCFGHIEYGLKAMGAARGVRDCVTPELHSRLKTMKYVQFLEEMERLVDRPDGVFPPLYAMPDEARPAGDSRTSWYDKYHQAALKHFNEVAAAAGSAPAAADGLRRIAKAAARRIPGANSLRFSRFARTVRRLLEPNAVSPEMPDTPASISSPAVLAPHPWAGIPQRTDFEKLLDDWGFTGLARLVRQRRLVAERYVRTLEPVMYRAGSEVHLPRSNDPRSQQ